MSTAGGDLNQLRLLTHRSPQLTGDIVLLPRQHDFRSPVISGRHVSRHLGILDSSQTKVTDLREAEISIHCASCLWRDETHLQVTVLVHQNVTRLQISVHDTGRVHVFQTTLRETFADQWLKMRR
jgi:hypothetical protein